MKIIKWFLIILVFYAGFMFINMPASLFFSKLKLPRDLKVQAVQGNFWQGSTKLTLQTIPNEIFELSWAWCPQMPRVDTFCLQLVKDRQLSASLKTPIINTDKQFKLKDVQLQTHSQTLQALLPATYELILNSVRTKVDIRFSKLDLKLVGTGFDVVNWQGLMQLNQFTYSEKNLGKISIRLDTELPKSTGDQDAQTNPTTNPIARLQQQRVLRFIISGGSPDLITLSGKASIMPDKRYQIHLQMQLHDTSLASMVAPFTQQTEQDTYLWTHKGRL